MRACAIVPAYQAERSVGAVVEELCRLWPGSSAVFVIDDGSTDGTARVAAAAGARVVSHDRNRGKGAALKTGLRLADDDGFDVAVSVDADGQHPPAEALRVLRADPDPGALVLGVRDLAGAGAPTANQRSNAISNFFLSYFAGLPMADTQCGLRRYPVRAVLDAGVADDGYAFESEVLLRAVARGIPVTEVPVRVIYPPEGERVTHFDSVRDPARIVARVVRTLFSRGRR